MVWVVHLVLHLGLGILIGHWVFSSHNILFRLSAGLVFGMVGAMWSAVPGAFLFGFTPTAHYLGWGLMGLAALLSGGWYQGKGKSGPVTYPEESFPHWDTVGILLVTMFICYLFTNHYFLDTEGAVYTRGNLYGDLPFHLGMITSLVEQGFFPPEYTFFPGAHLGYPFLTNLLSASLVMFGLPLRWAVLLPSFIFTYLLVFWFFQLSRLVLKRRLAVVLSAVLFFINGGFGAFYLLDNAWIAPDRLLNLVKGLSVSPTNWFENNIIWSNVICDLLLPQRTTLAGWAVLFFTLYLLYRAVTQKQLKDFFLAGCLGGLLPMVHTHSFFALCVIALCWLFLSFRREGARGRLFAKLIVFAFPFWLLALPQLLEWTMTQTVAGGFFRFQPGWANQGDIWPWFWLKNVGIVFILVFPALFSRNQEMNRFYLPAVIIFVLGDLFIFQPWAWDNIKLFFIWYLFTVFLISGYLVRLFDRLRGFPSRSLLLGILIFFGVFSGALSLVRETLLRPNQLFSSEQTVMAEFLKDNTIPDGLFLSAGHHNNAVMSLAGRTIFMGYDGWLWSHGIDYRDRQALIEEMYVQPAKFEELSGKNAIDYLVVGPQERSRFDAEWSFFITRYPQVYRSRNHLVYAISPRAKEYLPLSGNREW